VYYIAFYVSAVFFHRDHIQGYAENIYKRIFFDHKYKRGENIYQYMFSQNIPVVPDYKINEPEDQNRQEFIFVEVEKQPAVKRGIKQIRDDHEQYMRMGQPEFLSDERERESSGGHGGRLDHKKAFGASEDHIKRQYKIIYRRKMHREMRELHISLHACRLQPGFRHVFEHLREYPEIERRGPERPQSQNARLTYHEYMRQYKRRDQNQKRPEADKRVEPLEADPAVAIICVFLFKAIAYDIEQNRDDRDIIRDIKIFVRDQTHGVYRRRKKQDVSVKIFHLP